MNGIEYGKDPKNFFVKYNAPRRKYSDLRTEFCNDAVNIAKEHGPVYIGFSSGIDSQIITRCFLDMKLDAEYVFLHSVGYNDLEHQRVLECEKYYGIKVRTFEINIDQFKDQWIEKSKLDEFPSMSNYPFEWLSEQLPEPYPFVMQGTAEPAIVGSNSKNASVYHNYYDFMERRVEFMSKYRKILDFPNSPEAIASYYTDDTVKTFCETLQYLHENQINKAIPEEYPQQRYLSYFNIYAKPFVKGKYFKDIKWYGKLNGAEGYPLWFQNNYMIQRTKIFVPYWELVEFLENNLNTSKIYEKNIVDTVRPTPNS